MRFTKILLAVAGASLLLGGVVSLASAGRLSISHPRFKMVFTRVTFESELNPGLECSLTLEGSLHTRSMVKTRGALVGYITEARIPLCNFGQSTVLRETLPWHVRYRSFSGTLPAITGVALDIVGFSVITRLQGSMSCLTRTTAESPMTVTLTRETLVGRLTAAELEGRRVQTSCIFDYNNIIGRTGTIVPQESPTIRMTLTLI